jgi:hypothetical protein
MAVGNADPQPSPSPAASAFARQICGSSGFVDENEPSRIKVELRSKPLWRFFKTSVRCCARHAQTFFERDPVAIKEAPDHGGREALAANGNSGAPDRD